MNPEIRKMKNEEMKKSASWDTPERKHRGFKE
jgi:hypothetical protein